ncbi:hypothetical protein PUN28_002233 [Cardiocondyla obscurior]|uniref:Uncharacterized protein n=1 Tax=Cardiocondyla obscurior TaxID=286306 RepID=A0AAW2GT59_9HYME
MKRASPPPSVLGLSRGRRPGIISNRLGDYFRSFPRTPRPVLDTRDDSPITAASRLTVSGHTDGRKGGVTTSRGEASEASWERKRRLYRGIAERIIDNCCNPNPVTTRSMT